MSPALHCAREYDARDVGYCLRAVCNERESHSPNTEFARKLKSRVRLRLCIRRRHERGGPRTARSASLRLNAPPRSRTCTAVGDRLVLVVKRRERSITIRSPERRFAIANATRSRGDFQPVSFTGRD